MSAPMLKFDQWFLPAGERHLQEWMTTVNHRVGGRLTYQYSKYAAALRHCRGRRLAIDVGAHVGLWSYLMARDFARVEAFEPRAVHRECWERNITAPHAALHPFALGSTFARVALETGPSSSGDTRIGRADSPLCTERQVELRPLDSFALQHVDLIKIDCEGYETFVIEGATDTIRQWRPAVIVEQKPGHGQRFGVSEHAAVEALQDMGARCVWSDCGDYVMVFPSGA